MHDVYPSRPAAGGRALLRLLPFAVFLFFLALWTYELLAENPVPDVVRNAIPSEWRPFLAKSLHVAGYGFLTLLAGMLPVPRPVFWLVILGLLLHGIATEVGQTFTATRTGSAKDVGLDWVGVGVGLLMLQVVRRLRR